MLRRNPRPRPRHGRHRIMAPGGNGRSWRHRRKLRPLDTRRASRVGGRAAAGFFRGDFGQNDFEASVKAASDTRSPHSSAASRRNGAQTGKPDDGGKPTGDELAQKTIEALEE